MINVVKYILNQPEHHKKRTFNEEYLSILKKNEVEFDERYLFEWYDSATLLSFLFSSSFYKDFATTLQVFINKNFNYGFLSRF